MKSNLTVSIEASVLNKAQSKLKGKLGKICENALISELKKVTPR